MSKGTIMRFLILFSLFFTANLYAAGPHACAGDVQKFCQGVPKTKKDLDACLDKNEANLGPSCKSARENFESMMKEKNKCYGDMKKLCSNSKSVAEINKCLKDNESKLSKECIAQRDARMKEHLPCKADQEKFCSEQKRGKLSVAKCMIDNSDKFTKECKEAREKFEAKQLKKQPCFLDAIKLCDDKKTDPAALELCLSENTSSLSKLCQEKRKKSEDKMAARNPCYRDAVTHCSKERFKPELLKACLEKNHDKLSKLCQETRTLATRQQKNIKEACAGDEKKFCMGKPKKGNAIISCLKANLGRLSFQCKKAITD